MNQSLSENQLLAFVEIPEGFLPRPAGATSTRRPPARSSGFDGLSGGRAG